MNFFRFDESYSWIYELNQDLKLFSQSDNLFKSDLSWRYRFWIFFRIYKIFLDCPFSASVRYCWRPAGDRNWCSWNPFDQCFKPIYDTPWRQVVKKSSQCVWIGLQRDLLARLMTCYHWLIFKSFQLANLRRVWFTVISFHVQIVPSQIVPLNSQIVPQKSQFVLHI